MKTSSILRSGVVALSLLAMTACGTSEEGGPAVEKPQASTSESSEPTQDDEPGGRPTVLDMRRAIESNGVPELAGEPAVCFAELFVGSDLSDEGLNYLVQTGEAEGYTEITKKDRRVLDSEDFRVVYEVCSSLIPTPEESNPEPPDNTNQ